MATTNGITTTEHVAILDASSNLGKRKRIPTDEEGRQRERNVQNQSASLRNSIRSALDNLRNFDPSPSLLRHPLPSKSPDKPDLKRTRLSTGISEPDTIEKKILDGHYYSYEDVLKDVKALTPAILNEATSESLPNGTSSEPTSKTSDRIDAMQEFLTKASLQYSGTIKQEVTEPEVQDAKDPSSSKKLSAGQVLTVRTHTSTGPRQVFSGLQHGARFEVLGEDSDLVTPIDLRRLPNGFDIIEAAPLDAHMKRKEEKEQRTLGEVFAPARNAKPLETPRSSQSFTRGNTLDFVRPSEASGADNSAPVYKADHLYASLPTGDWIRYNQDQGKIDGLFRAAYSSFAPTYDDSSAVISQRTKADLWWQKRSRQRMAATSSSWPGEFQDEVMGTSSSTKLSDEGFAELAANLQPESIDLEEINNPDSHLKDVDDVLREISDLIQTLSSYQRSRDLELSRTISRTPSAAEFDTYEILKSQLSILVNTLPPFAVAKLNGDQLQDLNISTNFISNSNDYPGIGEADDMELQKRRAKLAATNAAARTPAPVQTTARPAAYQTPSTNYTQRTPAYSSNAISYSRPALTPYQTPRPPPATSQRPTYPQAQYGTAPAYGSSGSLQQFQRPMPNGYSSYGSNTPQMTPYSSQPKPMVNGHRPSIHGNSAPAASPPKVPALTPQQQMLQERQAQAIRMAAGNATSNHTSGHDGANEKQSETPKTEIRAE